MKNLSPEDLVGCCFEEKGFMSTSSKNSVASGTISGFPGDMHITIKASKGAKALDISSISQYPNEAEVLFDAGQKLIIASAENKNGILYIKVLAK